jgi:UDP-GlcNAc:undecaprenyl-phosphate GlcNAc-1-phosphate transferase
MTRFFLIAVAVAFCSSLLLTPLVRRLARWLEIVDAPDQQRKQHVQAIPLCGGVAVLLSFWLAIAALGLAGRHWSVDLFEDLRLELGAACATAFICCVGVLDDRFELRGRQKLLGQVVAAAMLVGGGLQIERFVAFGVTVELGLLAIPFTLFWLLGAVNSLNLLDGMDGLATSIGIILSSAICCMALMTGHLYESLLAASIAAALAGFLLFNFPPASIFLGDAGSMLIGLVLGVLAIRSTLKGPATVILAASAALWTIPAFDVTMAILRRTLTGRGIYFADRGHLHHTLLGRGWSVPHTMLVIGMLVAVTAVSAAYSVYLKNEWLAIVTVGAVVATLVVGRLFGHREFLLLLQRTKQFAGSLLPRPADQADKSRQMRVNLQGTRQWGELWQMLTEYGERFELSRIQLNLCLPALQEDYHASWDGGVRLPEALVWHSEIPLVAQGVVVGRLRLAGPCCGGSACSWVGELIDGLKPFETHLLDLIEECAEAHRHAHPASRSAVPGRNLGTLAAAQDGDLPAATAVPLPASDSSERR